MLIKKQIQEKEIFLTDDAKFAKELQKEAKAVIGICRENDIQDWWGVSYLVEREEAADEDYCMEAYCRFHKIPLQIGQCDEFLLRELKESDCPELLQLYDTEALRFLEAPDSLEDERKKIKAYIEKIYSIYGCGLWAVEEKINHQLIGYVGFQPEIWQGKNALFLGYLIRSDYRRRGIAKQACQMGIQFVEEKLGRQDFYCRISEENMISKMLAEKLGFQPLENDIYVRYAEYV